MITVRRRTNPSYWTAGATRLAGWPRGALLALVLGAFAAACQDATSPMDGLKPQFAQGDAGIWTVNTLADPGDGVCDDTECTLREAIFYAQSGDSIVFAPAMTGQIQLSAGNLWINKPLRIIGPGAPVLTVQGQVADNSVFYVYDPLTQALVEISGLTITGGAAYSVGGGVHNLESLTLREVVVTSNVAPNLGGGIWTGSGELTLLNTTVSGNAANQGGGIAAVNSQVVLMGSTLTGNSAVSTFGGGISIEGGDVTVLHTTISGNGASLAGAGISAQSGVLRIRSSTIVDMVHTGPIVAATFANTIFGGCQVDNPAGVTSFGHNVLEEHCDVALAPTDIVLSAYPQLWEEVLEAGLKDNGGPTQTHALIARGRAVDAGYCPGDTEDQRGFTRPVDDPLVANAVDGCDIGAFELQAPVGPVLPVADLLVSQAVNKTSVKQGELLTYTIRVQNLGTETAPNVVMNDVLSSGVTFVEARPSKGTHTAPPQGETGTVTWYLGEMANQDNQVAELVVTVLVKGKTTITNTATVTGEVADPNVANNTASITVSVGSGGGGGGGGKKK
jgi:uncharacterized repeat protein (TIGR01451 family)/CSLREA domain-containing protein